MAELKKFKGVIFDMDGLLVDSERISKEIYRKLFHDLGVELTDEIFSNVLGANRKSEEEYLNKIFGNCEKTSRFFERYPQMLLNAYEEKKIPLKKGAEELLLWLKDNNIPFALATSSPLKSVKAAFSDRKISLNDFTAIVTADDIKESKPNPEIFLTAAKKINCDINDCIVLEDSRNGIKAALNAKAIPIMVIDLYQPDEEIRKKVDFIQNDLNEVLEMFKKLYATN